MAELLLKKEISDFIKSLSKCMRYEKEILKHIHIKNGHLYITNGRILMKHNIEGRIPDGNYIINSIEKESKFFKLLKLTKNKDIEYPNPERVIPEKTDICSSFRFFKDDTQNLSRAIISLFEFTESVFDSLYIKMISLLDMKFTIYTKRKYTTGLSAIRMDNNDTVIALMPMPRF